MPVMETVTSVVEDYCRAVATVMSEGGARERYLVTVRPAWICGDTECPLDWEDDAVFLKTTEPWIGGGYAFGVMVGDEHPEIADYAEGDEGLEVALRKHYGRKGWELVPCNLHGSSQGEWVEGFVAAPAYAKSIAKTLQHWFAGDVYTVTMYELPDGCGEDDPDVYSSDWCDSLGDIYADSPEEALMYGAGALLGDNVVLGKVCY